MQEVDQVCELLCYAECTGQSPLPKVLMSSWRSGKIQEQNLES